MSYLLDNFNKFDTIRLYLAQPGSSKELFYVNDKLVLNPIELKAMDQLSIGDS